MTFPVVDREPVRLPTLTGHDDELWDALIELSEVRPGEWTLIGGQMVFLHAIEQGATPPRVLTDLDVLVNARIAGRPLAAFASGLEDLGFEQDGISPDGIAHRYTARSSGSRISSTSESSRYAAGCARPRSMTA